MRATHQRGPQTALRAAAPATRPTRRAHPAHAPRTRGRPTPPPGAAPRTRAPVRTTDLTTAHRRSSREAALRRHRPTAGSAGRGRRRNDRAGRPSSSQRRSRAPHAGAAAAARARRATAHTIGEGPQREAPSRTPPRPREEPDSLRHDQRCIPEGLSSRSPPRRAAPAPRSAPHAWPPGAAQAPGIRHAGPAASLNEIRASKKSLATTINPGPEARSSRAKNRLGPKPIASYRGHGDGQRAAPPASGRRTLRSQTLLSTAVAGPKSVPSDRLLHNSEGRDRGRPERGEPLPLCRLGFVSPTLPRVRGRESTTRDLARGS